MVLDADTSHNDVGATNDNIVVETALDWFRRARNERYRDNNHGYTPAWNDDADVDAATDSSMAAWRFLQFGKSGIAPIDAVWKRSRDRNDRKDRRRPLALSPVTILEGPRDVGKTWMILTLAARFVVATRASRFETFESGARPSNINSDEIEGASKGDLKTGGGGNKTRDDEEDGGSGSGTNNDGPIVLLLDSTYDFSLTQLATLVRLTLIRERQRQRQRQQIRESNKRKREQDVIDNHKGCDEKKRSQKRQIEDELERLERERSSLQQDMDDCLSRIHVIQVNNGSTGWVPILEAVKYQLSEERRCRRGHRDSTHSVCSGNSGSLPPEPPTLLLWDGFLSDIELLPNTMASATILGDSVGYLNNTQAVFGSPAAQELLMQLSRLMQKEPDSLWLVLTVRTISLPVSSTNGPTFDVYKPPTIERSGIGLRMTEWVRKDEERRQRQQRQKVSVHVQDRHPQNLNPNKQLIQPQRVSYRIRLDRRCESFGAGRDRIPRTAAAALALFAKVFGNDDVTDGNRSATTDEKIPYSISLGGILS